ncbi:hypothetical protein I6N98_06780 [Spongiibacter nanhainus]|uniref:Ferredoxin n=1 Tax=Spongiibacter nanhainus TaxID=2794344 RepID=A0A7T4USM0_9GAMM|nr:hypothetical protein [Spongiibacter nanhainus]QQD19550.1 hypothetical protein I6N98_06780 [Spongiibacter nanhainus]
MSALSKQNASIAVELTDREGATSQYQVGSLRELFDELCGELKIDGLCGGCCSCATCHVLVDGDDQHKLYPMEDDEREVLEGLLYSQSSSRLLCQCREREEGRSLSITLAPEE